MHLPPGDDGRFLRVGLGQISSRRRLGNQPEHERHHLLDLLLILIRIDGERELRHAQPDVVAPLARLAEIVAPRRRSFCQRNPVRSSSSSSFMKKPMSVGRSSSDNSDCFGGRALQPACSRRRRSAARRVLQTFAPDLPSVALRFRRMQSVGMMRHIFDDFLERQPRRILAAPIGQASADRFCVFVAGNVVAAEAAEFADRSAGRHIPSCGPIAFSYAPGFLASAPNRHGPRCGRFVFGLAFSGRFAGDRLFAALSSSRLLGRR